MNRYTYRVEWLPDYHEYVGVCLELPWLTERAATAQDVMAAIAAAVDRRLVEMHESGHPVPEPLGERGFSGTFVVRMSRQLHARLAREAVEQRVSMNQWVIQKLSGRELRSSLGLFGFD